MRVTTQPLTSAPDEDVYLPSPAIDDIQEIGNISLQVKLKQKPLNVVMRPDGTTPDFTWENGVLNIRNLTVHIHNTVEIELTAESDYQ